jgi:gas vesicle protein
MSGKSGNTLLALLAGAAIGAGMGILFAPDKGTKTRGKIKNGYNDSKDELAHSFDEMTKKLQSKLGQSKKDFHSAFDDLVAHAKNEKEDIIETLEKKLKELKKSAQTATK